jgi:hypothetical protein
MLLRPMRFGGSHFRVSTPPGSFPLVICGLSHDASWIERTYEVLGDDESLGTVFLLTR